MIVAGFAFFDKIFIVRTRPAEQGVEFIGAEGERIAHDRLRTLHFGQRHLCEFTIYRITSGLPPATPCPEDAHTCLGFHFGDARAHCDLAGRIQRQTDRKQDDQQSDLGFSKQHDEYFHGEAKVL